MVNIGGDENVELLEPISDRWSGDKINSDGVKVRDDIKLLILKIK